MHRPAKPQPADQDTRGRLLDAAIRLFAEAGFKRVTVRAICRAARANVAAVNYHFRDKLGLYREVTEAGIAMMQETTDLAAAAAVGRTPEEQLRAYVTVVTERLVGPSSHEWVHRFIAREMIDPTPALSSLVDRGMRPRLDHLAEIIGGLLNLPPDHPQVVACVTSVHAQILLFRSNPITQRLRAKTKTAPASPAEIAAHIATFSLAGIRAVRAV
jgi:AcrR family transcriptional regulator